MDDFPEDHFPAPKRRLKPMLTRQQKKTASKEVMPGENIGLPGVRFIKLPHKNGPKFNVGNPLAKDFLASAGEGGALASTRRELTEKMLRGNMSLAYWRSSQARIKEQLKVDFSPSSGGWGAILPALVVSGTITRRAVEKTWLTASNAKEDRIGSELKTYIRWLPNTL